MPSLGTSPNFYSTGHVMTTCGADVNATQAETLTFGFVARSLRIVNTCGDPLYFSLDPNTTASTGSATIAASGGAFQTEDSLSIETLTLKTTSTSTAGGVPLARPKDSVMAWSD